MGFAHGWFRMVFGCLGSVSLVLVWVLRIFGKKSQKYKKKKKLGMGPFAGAKVAKSFAAAKAASPWRGRGPKRPPHGFTAA